MKLAFPRRRMRTASPLLGAVVAMTLSVCTPGTAQAAPRWNVQSQGACPNETQVSAALDYVFKVDRDSAVDDESSETDWVLLVTDLGTNYRVSIGEQAREYSDLKRDCEERAHVAAVFAVMTLEPPDVAARPKPARMPPLKSQHWFELLAGGVSDIGLRQSDQIFAWGGELRAALAAEGWAVELGAGGRTKTTIPWGSYRAGIIRFPMDISLRGSRRWTHVMLSASAGPVLAIFYLRGEGTELPRHDGGTRLDVGFRSALSVTLLPNALLSPFLSLHGSVWPKPYNVVVDEQRVGTTPQVWVGATLGIMVSGR